MSESTGERHGGRFGGRGNGRAGRGHKRWGKQGKKTTFTGNTVDMNGHVFQLSTERRKRGQFRDTLDQLLTHTGIHHKQEIEYLKPMLKNLETPVINVPQPPSDRKSLTAAEEALLTEETKQYIKMKRNVTTAMASLYTVVWGQCSQLLQNKLTGLKSYEKMDLSNDVVKLLKEIKILGNKVEDKASEYEALFDAKRQLFRYQQKEDESLADHLRNFNDIVHMIEHYGGDIFYDKDMARMEADRDKEKGVKALTITGYNQRVIDKNMAICLLKTACQKRYGWLLQDLRNQHSYKIDVFPTNVTDMYGLLSIHTKYTNNQKRNSNHNATKGSINMGEGESKHGDDTNAVGLSYLQEDVVAGTDGKIVNRITCFKCNKRGHYADQCPTNNTTEHQHHMQSSMNEHHDNEEEHQEVEDQHLQVGDNGSLSDESVVVHFSWAQVNLNQQGNNQGHGYTDADILIDTGSTFSIFKNPKMVLNVRKSRRPLKALSNGGKQESYLTADLPGFFPVWYNPKSMLNILAWCDLRKRFRITVDTEQGAYIVVHMGNDKKIYFEEVESGLYLLRSGLSSQKRISGYSFLTLAEGNVKDFNRSQIDKAQRAMELHQSLGYPGYKKYFWLLKNNLIEGCDVAGRRK